MSLKFGKIKLNKKEFHRSKQSIYLNQAEISKIVISGDFELDDGVEKFIGYKNGGTVKPLCIILPQMNRFIKYFENNKKVTVYFLFMYFTNPMHSTWSSPSRFYRLAHFF